MHIRLQADPEQPWRGVAPLASAAIAGRLSAETMQALADEASGPRGSLLPTPVDGNDPTIATLKADIQERFAARSHLVESTLQRMGGDGSQSAAERRLGEPHDWARHRARP